MTELSREQKILLLRKARELWAKQILKEDLRLKRSDIVENSSISKEQKEQIQYALLTKTHWNQDLMNLYVKAILEYHDKRRQERRQISAKVIKEEDQDTDTAK